MTGSPGSVALGPNQEPGNAQAVKLDINEHLNATSRAVTAGEREGVPTAAVRVARPYPVTADDLWPILTTADHIRRWFAPISGELKLGGRYQLLDNAGGLVTACDPPSHFAVTWEFGGGMSWLELALAADQAGTRLTLTHDSPVSDHWTEYGPGAVGVGWELGLMGLALYLADPHEPRLDEEEFVGSSDGKAFIAHSSDGWRQAAVDFGTDATAAREAASRTTAFYTGVELPDAG